MSSRRQLVLEVIRRHFRALGQSPSHNEIAESTGLKRQHVGGWLKELQAAGLITFTPNRARSIVLVDRMANFADSEIEAAAHARGATIVWPPVIAPLAEAFPVDFDVPDYGLKLLQEIDDIT